MASGAKDSNGFKRILPWIGIIITITVLSAGAFVTWGRTAEKVYALEQRYEAIDKRVVEEFKKVRNEQKEWRKRDSEDRKLIQTLMRDILRKMD